MRTKCNRMAPSPACEKTEGLLVIHSFRPSSQRCSCMREGCSVMKQPEEEEDFRSQLSCRPTCCLKTNPVFKAPCTMCIRRDTSCSFSDRLFGTPKDVHAIFNRVKPLQESSGAQLGRLNLMTPSLPTTPASIRQPFGTSLGHIWGAEDLIKNLNLWGNDLQDMAPDVSGHAVYTCVYIYIYLYIYICIFLKINLEIYIYI